MRDAKTVITVETLKNVGNLKTAGAANTCEETDSIIPISLLTGRK
tara:strand:+ start:1473 stop:1607 length:135 start_codon:yes stop_codon:yes gene_type:complete